MSAGDVFLLVVRWLHLVTAAFWIGGSLLLLLVLRPLLNRAKDAPPSLAAVAAAEFRTLVNLSIVVLIATGAILAFDRLAAGVVAAPYAVTLGIKSALTVWMFLIVHAERRRSRRQVRIPEVDPGPRGPSTGIQRLRQSLSGYNAVVILGLIVFLLSDLLKVLFEMALSRN